MQERLKFYKYFVALQLSERMQKKRGLNPFYLLNYCWLLFDNSLGDNSLFAGNFNDVYAVWFAI